jgi:hypothetical protein
MESAKSVEPQGLLQKLSLNVKVTSEKQSY